MFCRPGIFFEDKTGPSTAKKPEKLPSIFRVGVQASSALTVNNAIIFFLQSFYPRSPPMTTNIPVHAPFIITFLKHGFYYRNFFLVKNPENSSHRSLKFSALSCCSFFFFFFYCSIGSCSHCKPPCAAGCEGLQNWCPSPSTPYPPHPSQMITCLSSFMADKLPDSERIA